MAIFTLARGGAQGYPDTSARKVYVIEGVLDAASQPLAQNDVAELINVPAGSFVQLVQYEVEAVEGEARNFSIGDGSDADGYITSTSANSEGAGISSLALTEGDPNTVTGYTAGKYYAEADTIDLTAVTSGGLTAAVIRVKAVVIDLN